ncbi:hypothetical protein [Priestia megaterium]|uniref:hypothetical protein n=1 Tax=Priestia megaterium TaxID=1404 RepID=UPI001AE04CED|nr:hypothetical protein [Priestia megaterium]
MNLLKDLNGILQAELNKLGYRQIQKKDTHNLLAALFNVQDKTVSVKRRRVYISEELKVKEVEEPYNDYLKQIRNKFKNGKDINPHLSGGSTKLYKKDPLLYDWGIHHLHLNNKLNSKGLIERSDYLLFFILKEDVVYFIDVSKHKLEDRTEFSQQYLLGIVKRNWPYLLEPFKLPVTLSRKNDDKAHSLLRGAGIATFVDVDGEAYGLMGGGISSAKTNLTHTRKADDIIKSLRDQENILKTAKKELKDLTSEFKISPIKTDYKLILEDKSFYIVESRTGTKTIEIQGLYNSVFGHLVNV